jgi:glutamate dehydrogenase/leucine dehydrogenase
LSTHVVQLDDPASGLRGSLVLDHRERGPCFGGIRLLDYTDDAACEADARRLAASMTAKCVIAGLPAGGAKVALRAEALDLRGTPGTDAEIAAIRELLGRAQATGICALRLALHAIQLQLPETG